LSSRLVKDIFSSCPFWLNTDAPLVGCTDASKSVQPATAAAVGMAILADETVWRILPSTEE
jgi:hypothetical protein